MGPWREKQYGDVEFGKKSSILKCTFWQFVWYLYNLIHAFKSYSFNLYKINHIIMWYGEYNSDIRLEIFPLVAVSLPRLFNVFGAKSHILKAELRQ